MQNNLSLGGKIDLSLHFPLWAFPPVGDLKGKQVRISDRQGRDGGHGDHHSTQKTSANHMCALMVM